MSERGVTESVVEQVALARLEIAPGEPEAGRADYARVALEASLRDALAQLNPALPPEALENAVRRLTRPEGAELSARNRTVHRLLVEGVTSEYRAAGGEIRRSPNAATTASRSSLNNACGPRYRPSSSPGELWVKDAERCIANVQ